MTRQPPERRRRTCRAAWAALLLAAGCWLAGCGSEEPGAGSQPGETVMSFTPSEHPATPWAGDREVERAIAAGEVHAYEVEAAAGELVRARAVQRGGDVELRLFAGGKAVMRMDSPTGGEGAEVVSDVAAAAATYRLEVHAADPDAPGPYALTVERRAAGRDDRTQVAAEHAFAAAAELRRDRRWAEAGDLYRQAADGFAAAGDAAAEAGARYAAAWMASEDHADGWEAALGEAAGRFAALGDERMEMRARNRLGNGLLHARRHREALPPLTRALELAERLADHQAWGGALNGLGDAYRRLGRPQEAQDAYLAALPHWEQSGDRRAAGTTWLRLGSLYVSVHRLDEAQDALDRAAETARELGDLEVEALVWRDLGNLHHLREDPAEARRALERALDLHSEAGSDEQTRATMLSDLGTVLLLAGDPAAAEERFETALAIFRAAGNVRGEATMLHKLGRQRHALGAHEEARRLHGEAEELFRRVGDLQGATSARFGVARALYHQDRHHEAHALLAPLLDAAEELRRRSAEPELRTAYVESRHHYWELHVANLMHLAEREPWAEWEVRALAASERGRARALLDLMQASGARRQASEEQLAEERTLLDRLNALETKRRGSEGERRRKIERRIADVGRDLRRLREEVRTLDRRAAAAEPLVVSTAGSGFVSEVQKQLGGDTLMVVYALGDEASFAWAVTHRQIVARRLPPRDEVEAAARRAAAAFRSSAAGDEALRRGAASALARLVLAPLWEALAEAGIDRGRFPRLAVVADGALHYVPFAALPSAADAGRPLVADHEVVVEPSAASLVALRRRAPARFGGELAVVFDPVYGADDPRLGGRGAAPTVAPLAPLTRAAEDVGLRLRRLPATAREAEAVRAALGVSARDQALALSGFEANRDRVHAGRLGAYRVLHFATHGLIDRQRPELSGLALSQFAPDGEPRDGFLRLADVYALDVEAELVVLSACESGVGRVYRGEGLAGFAHGFLSAGARRLVVSLWNVGDDETADLMERFYAELAAQPKDRRSASAALRETQLALLGEGASSHRWAAFVALGDWRGFALADDPIAKPEHGGGGDPPPTDPDDDLPPPGVPNFLGGGEAGGADGENRPEDDDDGGQR